MPIDAGHLFLGSTDSFPRRDAFYEAFSHRKPWQNDPCGDAILYSNKNSTFLVTAAAGIRRTGEMSNSVKKQIVVESELVERARSGCRVSMERIVRMYHSEIRGFLVRRTGDLAVADDLAQDVFLTAVTKISTLKESANLRSWLFAVTRNKLIDHLRKKQVKSNGNSSEIENILANESISRTGSESHVDDELMLRALRACVDRLNPDAKAIVSARYFDDCDSNQIAHQTNKNADAIRMALMRIRKALARCIRRQLGDEVSI